MRELVIYGAGDLGREYVWFIEGINAKSPCWKIRGFVDDEIPAGTVVYGIPVLGPRDYLLHAEQETAVVCSIAVPSIKRRIVEALSGCPWIVYPSLIHPTAVVAPDLVLGEGSVIAPGCVVSIETTTGRPVIVNQHTSISHNVTVGDYAMIAPACQLGGWVQIGAGVDMGVGCTVKMEARIGQDAVLGAGAVVVKDIPPRCTAVGVPARPIKYHVEETACTKNT